MRTAMSKGKNHYEIVHVSWIFAHSSYFHRTDRILFVSSLKPYAQIESDMSNIRAFIPYGDLSLDNYINVIVKADFFKFFKNSVVVTIIFVLLATTINAMIGYALGMLNFRGKAIIISTIVALSIIPTESIIINRFMTVNSLGMLNTYIGLAIPSVAYPMYMYLYYNHLRECRRNCRRLQLLMEPATGKYLPKS